MQNKVMSNTDGEDTQRIKLTPKDAGYKYFTCPMCDGHGQIGQDQHDQNNKDVEAQIETVQELASLREQLAKKDEEIGILKDERNRYNLAVNVLLDTDEETALANAWNKAMVELKQKEDENRELKKVILHYFDTKNGWGHEGALEAMKAKDDLIKKAKNLSA